MAWGLGLVGLGLLGAGIRVALASAREEASRPLLGRIEALKAQELEVRGKLAAVRAERARAAAQLEHAWSTHLAELRQHEPTVPPKPRPRERWARRWWNHQYDVYYWWEHRVTDATTTLECLRLGYEFAPAPPENALEMPQREDHGLVWED